MENRKDIIVGDGQGDGDGPVGASAGEPGVDSQGVKKGRA